MLVGAYQLFLDGLGKVGFDINKLPPDVRAKLNAPDVRAAGDRIDAYKRKVCGPAGS